MNPILKQLFDELATAFENIRALNIASEEKIHDSNDCSLIE